MPLLAFLPFGAFFICCILQFWFLKRIKESLIDRHPDTFLAIEKTSIFPMQGLWKFSRGRQYKQLGDPELNRHVRNLRILMVIAFLAWVGFAISIFATGLNLPRLPVAIANGSYVNSCCGMITLKDGQITIAEQKISYVIESDKTGSYVLTPFYVGASAQGFSLRRDGYPLKMYLDNQTHPAVISLMNDGDGEVFSFRRATGS